MKIILKGRGEGKTTELIKESAKTGKYILTADRNRVCKIDEMAKRMGLHIPFPITVEEAMRYRFRDSFINRILIDDADDVLRMIFQVEIDTITLTKDKKKTQRPYKDYQDLRTGEYIREYKGDKDDTDCL